MTDRQADSQVYSQIEREREREREMSKTDFRSLPETINDKGHKTKTRDYV